MFVMRAKSDLALEINFNEAKTILTAIKDHEFLIAFQFERLLGTPATLARAALAGRRQWLFLSRFIGMDVFFVSYLG